MTAKIFTPSHHQKCTYSWRSNHVYSTPSSSTSDCTLLQLLQTLNIINIANAIVCDEQPVGLYDHISGVCLYDMC